MLLGFLLVGAGWVGAEEATLESLQKSYDEAMQALGEKYQAAKTPEEKKEILAKRPDAGETVKAMLPLMEKEGDASKVLEAAGWVIAQSRQGIPEEVYGIIEKHKGSKEMVGILLMASYDRSGKLMETLEWARENSEHKEVQGVAAYVKSQDRSLPDDEKLAELKFALANIGDVEFRGQKIAERAKGSLYELENLRVGQVAGEIEGEDQEGVPFKLSDYRGKVVVLDFWGDW